MTVSVSLYVRCFSSSFWQQPKDSLSQLMLWSENHLLVVLAVLLEKEISISIELASRWKHKVLWKFLLDRFWTTTSNTGRWHDTKSHHNLQKLHDKNLWLIDHIWVFFSIRGTDHLHSHSHVWGIENDHIYPRCESPINLNSYFEPRIFLLVSVLTNCTTMIVSMRGNLL